MLQIQGLNQYEINEILNGDYTYFSTDKELINTFSLKGNYQNILRYLDDGYSIEQLQNIGVSSKEIEQFMDTLEKCNLTVENAKAINQYSNDSNMILSIKKGLVDKAQVKEKISAEMISKLQSRGISEEQITSIESYIEGLDFNKPVHENYEEVNRYLNEINISSNCYSSVCTAIKSKNSLAHIESTLVNLDEGLSKARLPQSMKLYRAIKTNGDINAKDYIEKNMSNDGYTSTSPLYETSFAKYDDYDTVIEIVKSVSNTKFVKNVKRKKQENLVKGSKFL